jgi:hypothetical protein
MHYFKLKYEDMHVFINAIKNQGIKLLIFFPILFLLIYWYIFSVDIPWYDDVMVIAFNRNAQTQGLDFTLIKQLFANYNEHILVVTKVIFWLNYTCLGYINLSYISLQGIIIYLAFIYLLIRVTNRAIYSKIIILFTLSSLMYNEGYLWAMTSIQNFASLLFTLLSIIAIADKKIKLSLIFLTMGLLSSAQTLIIVPFLIIISYYHQILNWKLFFVLIVLLLFYFFGYEKTGIQPDIQSILHSFSKERILNILNFYAPPFGNLGASFSLVYSAVEFILLLLVLGNIGVDFKNKQLTKRKIILASLLLWSTFILFFSFIIRFEIVPRYLLYSNIKTVTIFLYLLEINSNRKIAYSLSIAAILFYFATLFPAFVLAKNTHLKMNELKFNLLKNKISYFFSTDDVDARKVTPYYKELDHNKVINIPNRLNGRRFSHLLLFNQISNEQINLSKFSKKFSGPFNVNDGKAILINKKIIVDSLSEFTVYQNNISSKNLIETFAIILKSKDLTIQFCYEIKMLTLTQFIKKPTLINQITIYKNSLPYGEYDMYLIKYQPY